MSRHLRALRESGLVEEGRDEFDSRVRVYRAFAVFTREIASSWQPSSLVKIPALGDAGFSSSPASAALCTTIENGKQFEIGRIAI